MAAIPRFELVPKVTCGVRVEAWAPGTHRTGSHDIRLLGG
jgi:hypothetical protein